MFLMLLPGEMVIIVIKIGMMFSTVVCGLLFFNLANLLALKIFSRFSASFYPVRNRSRCNKVETRNTERLSLMKLACSYLKKVEYVLTLS